MSKKCFALALAAVVASASAASANTISATVVDILGRASTAAETGAAANPVPAGSKVYTFQITTDSDILAFENVSIVTTPAGAALYQNPFGDAGNANKPNDALIPAFPSLSADSYFDTPGNTSRLGADLPGDGATTFGDLDANGPQNNFVFAQLTYPGDVVGTLNFRASINSTVTPGVPFSQDFSIQFGIPEPASFGLCGFAMIGLAAARRRFKA
jgi:hypothetical protein